MRRDHFEESYSGTAPWDIPGPQPAVIELAKSGEVRGDVLDVGCGAGENALYLASLGHETLGLDFVDVAIARAQAKAKERGSQAQFIVASALELSALQRQFDTVLDCGLFHTFPDDERLQFVAGLKQVVRPHGHLFILCFSEHEPAGPGPRRVTKVELHATFAAGWRVESIRDIRFAINELPDLNFSPGGPKAYLVSIERTAD